MSLSFLGFLSLGPFSLCKLLRFLSSWQVSNDLLRLHIDGEVVDEKCLSASKDGETYPSPLRKISLVSTNGTDDGIVGYLYSPKVLHPSSSIEDHHKVPFVKFVGPFSCGSDIIL